MANVRRSFKYRALLTETLPYEVPVIFSNKDFYNSLREDVKDVDLRSALSKLRRVNKRFTIPYNFHIRKDISGRRALSVMHPLHQLSVCEFYDNYHPIILASCEKSNFSIRYPSSVSSDYAVALEQDAAAALIDGETQVEVSFDERDVPAIKNYFKYSGYSLIGKFYESREFIRLEKRFSCLRRVDVARCFESIYTHTLSWSVKGKDIAKRSASENGYSFEASFDRIMQRANYNETNGIIIGPEISRVFAEIIFQDVDASVAAKLSAFTQGWDYDIRRYVDDYFIFANSPEMLDSIERALVHELEKFKLALKAEKTETFGRPFVTPISTARRELKLEFRKLTSLLGGEGEMLDRSVVKRQATELRDDIRNIRIIVARNGVRFFALSGWMLGTVKTSISRMASVMSDWITADLEADFVELLTSLLELAFYIIALDIRVQPTYTVGQIMALVQPIKDSCEEHNKDQIAHILSDELLGLIRHLKSHGVGEDSVALSGIEISNLLICGAHFCGPTFLRNRTVSEILRAQAMMARPTYFSYITAKFCMLRDGASFAAELAYLNSTVVEYVRANKASIDVDSEVFLLLSDLLSAPDLDEAEKRRLFDYVYGGTLSKKTMSLLAPRVRFANWSGLSVEYLLKRKVLHPAYA